MLHRATFLRSALDPPLPQQQRPALRPPPLCYLSLCAPLRSHSACLQVTVGLPPRRQLGTVHPLAPAGVSWHWPRHAARPVLVALVSAPPERYVTVGVRFWSTSYFDPNATSRQKSVYGTGTWSVRVYSIDQHVPRLSGNLLRSIENTTKNCGLAVEEPRDIASRVQQHTGATEDRDTD
eukprot:COSAG03_NODE_7629_length_891_cov_362.248737_1_plen_178_part_10